MLDMDGTLLDLHYDNHFWFTLIPQTLAEKRSISLDAARAYMEEKVSQHQGTLQWYCLDFWSEQLGINIIALKKIETERIRLRQDALSFLQALARSDKKVWLVTNSHPAGLKIKLSVIDIAVYFDEIISSHQFGYPKENTDFWETLQGYRAFDSASSVFIDDSLPVLACAENYGIAYPILVETPDSKKPRNSQSDYLGINHFNELQFECARDV